MHARTFSFLPLLAALLAVACAPAGGPPPAPAAPAPSPSAQPAATPSAVATPAATPTPAPAATATAEPIATDIDGTVYDLAGQPVAGVRVTVRALGATPSFTGEATTDAAGRYAIAQAPPAVDLEVQAQRAGWTPRRRLASVAGARQAIDFGGDEVTAAAFFLSPHPEITATEPLNGALYADPSRLTFSLTLSEPLDAANRERFEAALRLMPANREAGGGEDLALNEDVYPLERLAKALGRYVIADGTAFRPLSAARAQVMWSADGRRATFTFNAPLLEHRTRAARYQVVLAAGAEPIRDAEGLTLGTGPAGVLNSWPQAGGLVLGAFHSLDNRLRAIAGIADGPAARWAATHDNHAGFRLDNDGAAPRLLAARVQVQEGDTHLRLSFDEPLIAYDGTDEGLVATGTGQLAADLAGITFAVGERDDLADVRLDGELSGSEVVIDPRATATFGAEGERRREVGFAAGAFALSAAGEPDGTVTLALDERDPFTLVLTIHGRDDFFAEALREIKVRVEGLADPVGNARDEDEADDDVVTATL